MALPSSAPISFSQVVTEFGGTNSLSAYVRGGSYVPNTAGNAAISATAAGLALSQFYGASDLVVLFSGSRDTDTAVVGGDDYRYFKTPAIVDTNGYTWTFRVWTQGANAGKTTVEVAANVAQSYWASATWKTNTITQASAESFTAWDGAKTVWLVPGTIIDPASGGQEDVLSIYA
jgi:hypothetical protein